MVRCNNRFLPYAVVFYHDFDDHEAQTSLLCVVRVNTNVQPQKQLKNFLLPATIDLSMLLISIKTCDVIAAQFNDA